MRQPLVFLLSFHGLHSIAANDDSVNAARRAGKEREIVVAMNQLVYLGATERLHRHNLIENHVAYRVGKRHVCANLDPAKSAKMRSYAVARDHKRIIQKRSGVAAGRTREPWIAPSAVDRKFEL